MEQVAASEMRQRVLNLIEETGAVLGLVPRLLDDNEQLQARAESAGRDNERLREELAAVRAELEQLRRERDEMADSFTRTMNEMVEVVNQMVSRLRPAAHTRPAGRSPFDRDAAPAAPAPQPSPFSWKA